MTDEYLAAVDKCLCRFSILANAPKPLTAAYLEAWSAVFSDQGVEERHIEPVTLRILSEATFFPTPADFLGIWRAMFEFERRTRQRAEYAAREEAISRARVDQAMREMDEWDAEVAARKAAAQDRVAA